MENYWLKYLIYYFEDDKLFNLIYSYFGIKIYIYSKENGHNEPHIHVKYQGKEVVICIRTGEVLAGYINKKKLNFVKKWTIENKDFLMDNWGRLVEGIVV